MYHLAHRAHLNEDRTYYFRYKTFEDGKPRDHGKTLLDGGDIHDSRANAIVSPRDVGDTRNIVTDREHVMDRRRRSSIRDENQRNGFNEISSRPRVSVLVEHWSG